ncbi:MAG TPA: energy transducer TonB [Bryobacteraceae bacterium]|nr:energy transducer TonB [Bryobacteraceae bacterium]
MQIRVGAMLTEELLQQEQEALKGYNEPLAILVRQSIRQEEFLKAAPETRKTFIPPAHDNAVNIIIWNRATPPQRIRVDGREHESMLIEKTTPDAHVGKGEPGSSPVKLAIVIGKDGTVIEIDPLAGPEPLVSPAVDAVRRWKYKPTTLNGHSVEIETTVDLAFPSVK